MIRPYLLPLLLLPPVALAQTPTSTHQLLEQLRSTQRVGAVALSEDGSTVAMDVASNLTVAPVAHPEKGRIVPLCNTPQGSPRPANIEQLAFTRTSLTVLSECNGVTEITMPSLPKGDSTGTFRAARLDGYANSLTWSPDGKLLALLYTEGSSRPTGALAAEKPQTGVIGQEPEDVQRVALIDSHTGRLRELTPAGLNVYEFSFSPDSKKIAFIAAPPPGQNNWWVARLYTQPVSGEAPSAILDPATVPGPLHGLQIAVPRWSPDGSTIAFIGGLMSDQGATGGDLYTVPADGSGGPMNWTPVSRTTIQWIDWLPSGKLLATVINGGSEQIDELSFTFPPGFRAPHGTRIGVVNRLTEKTIEQLPYSIRDGRLAGSFAISQDGAVAAWAASSYAVAPEVYAGPLNGTPLPAITHINENLKPAWGPAKSIDWTNDGFHIQGWLLYPPDYDPAKKYGLIVLVHGGPSWSVTPHWPYAGFGSAPIAASGYFVLEPNPRGSYGQGEGFTQANRRDFGYGDLRDDLAGIDTIEKQIPAIDDRQLGITGWSYGGFTTMFAVTQTHRFHAAVAGAGISDWLSYYGENQIDQWMIPFFGASVYDDPAVYAKSSAIHFIKNVTTPTLIVVGERDGECPAPQSFEFWHALRAFHVPTELVVYPDEGHGFSKPADQQDVLERTLGWFHQYLH